MKVILLKDVKNQGKKNDIIEVSAGYGNNYLIKNKLAVLYTKTSQNILQQELAQQQADEAAQIIEFNKIKAALTNQVFEFKVKTGVNDKVFGAITPKQIATELNQKGFPITKKQIHLIKPLDSLGIHLIQIELPFKVTFKLKIILKK